VNAFWEGLVGQLIALITFFVFPAIRYFLLKRLAKHEGRPQLWYLPAYGFRLVIRNLPREKTLSEIKTHVFLRKIISPASGVSIATFIDTELVQNKVMFLFPGNDHILVAFRLEDGEKDEGLYLVRTDKLSRELSRSPIRDFDKIISDFTANLKNWFNFDIKISKRIELKSDSLRTIWNQVKQNNTEQYFEVDNIIDV